MVKVMKSGQNQDLGEIKLIDERVEEIKPRETLSYPINF